MTENHSPRMSSVIGESAVVIGNVTGRGDLEIRGRVQGGVHLDGRLLIAESGVVLGPVEAVEVTVRGEVRGDLTSSEGTFIETPGRVEGNIDSPRVGIEAGARVRGMLRTGGELPVPETTKAKAPPPDKPSPPGDRSLEEPTLALDKPALPASVLPEPTVPASALPEPALPERPKKRRRLKKGGKKNPEGMNTERRPEPGSTSRQSETPRLAKETARLTTEAARLTTEAARLTTETARTGSAPRRGPPPMPTFKKGSKGLKRS